MESIQSFDTRRNCYNLYTPRSVFSSNKQPGKENLETDQLGVLFCLCVTPNSPD